MTKENLDLLTEIYILLMLGKGTTRDEICCGIHQYAEANDKYMKN